MNSKHEQQSASRKPVRVISDERNTKASKNADAAPPLRPARSGLMKTLAKIGRSSPSLRPLEDTNGRNTPGQGADAQPPASLDPTAPAAERRKSFAPAMFLSAMTKATTMTRSQANLREQIPVSSKNLPPSGATTTDRRRAEALHSLGLLPASRRYSSVFPGSYAEPVAEGGRDGMSAADVIRQEWKLKIKEEGGGLLDEKDDQEVVALVPSSTGTSLDTTKVLLDSQQERTPVKKQRSQLPAPLVLPQANSEVNKDKLNAWSFPKSPRSPLNSVSKGQGTSQLALITESPTSVTSGEDTTSPGSGMTAFFSANSSPVKTSSSSTTSRHAQKRSDCSVPSSPRSSVTPQSSAYLPSSSIATSLNETSSVEKMSHHHRTSSKSSQLRFSVVSNNNSASSDKVNEWLSKTPIASRPSTQPPSPRLASGVATPQSRCKSSAGPKENADSMTLSAALVPLPLSPVDLSPRQVPVDSLPPLSPSLVPLPTSARNSPSVLPVVIVAPQKKAHTSSTYESAATLPSLTTTSTSITSCGPSTPISPLDIRASDRSLPPSPVLSGVTIETVPQMVLSDNDASKDCDINVVDGGDRFRVQTSLDDEGSGRVLERMVEENPDAVPESKVSKSMFGRRQNMKDANEGNAKQSASGTTSRPRANTTFSNMRKSFVASFPVGSRSKQANRSSVDPAGLTSYRKPDASSQVPPGTNKSANRRISAPVAPTMHSRASIMIETGAIKDEESRRLSEVAFML